MRYECKAISEYVRDKNRNRIGFLYAFRKGNEVLFGWSKYAVNKEKGRFDREDAVSLAITRAIKGRLYSRSNLPFALRKPMDTFFTRCAAYFKEPIHNYVGEVND